MAMTTVGHENNTDIESATKTNHGDVDLILPYEPAAKRQPDVLDCS